MVLFNYSTKELTAKVVYYGPGLCGKTTNLQWVHEKLPIKNKGKMLSLATETDRTLFFDFLPIEIGSIRGMKTRIQLYTVPGQVFYNATRRMVLKGADAVVFVCDSQEAMLDANLESFENMRQNLEANEIDPDEVPIVLQYNKRDLPNALPIEILNERMNPHNYPFNEAIAVTGVGVEDTLKAVTKLVFKSLSAKYGEAAPPVPGPGGRPASLPGIAPAPAAAPTPAPAAVASAPAGLADGEEEDLLGDLAEEPSPAPDPGLPDVELDDEHTPVSGFGQPVRPRTPTPGHDPHGTLVSSRDEADELRRRIANPGIPEAEVEMDVGEEDDEADPTRARFVPPPAVPYRPQKPEASPPPPTPAPKPRPFRVPSLPDEEESDEATEVPIDIEVEPIDIEVKPGTTRVSLHLRVVLNLRR